jgi:prolyl oligopeptidase
MRSAPVLLFLLAALCLQPTPPAAAATPDDPYLWLEDLKNPKTLEWVKKQDVACERDLTRSATFESLRVRFLAILNSDARIPTLEKIGDRYYNFWRDAKHVRGVWRRTTLEEYRKPAPAWETVLDLDSLAAAEKENWVWSDPQPLPPDYTRCLLPLSRGGADAAVIREFDLATKAFVEGGFALPESKSVMNWIDRDRVFVALAIDSSTMTMSGYPRIVKEWRRGTPLDSARLVYEGQAGDVAVEAGRDFSPGFERDFVRRSLTTFSDELHLRRGDALVKIEKPADAEAGFFREWLLLRLRSDWTVGGATHPAGSLLAADLERYLAGDHRCDVLFRPSERTVLHRHFVTRNAILLNVLDNVRGRAYAVRRDGSAWTTDPLPGLPDLGVVSVKAVDPNDSDDYWVTLSDLLTPSRLCLGSVASTGVLRPAGTLRESPAFFDATGLAVTQHEAVSKDGTKVPYFEVAPTDLRLDGTAPALLTGYGGFEIPMLPYYNPLAGKGWMERGGVHVLANIRGGGEFGPRWHRAAMGAARPRAYEDFVAVAEDLVRRKVTSPRHLACMGGSNGGLLVGNMLTTRPDLFRAVVCQAPLLDMKRYHKLDAGASWMEEYGNPDDPAQWEFMRPFSAYQNLRKGVEYPPTLFTASTRDDRVHPGHARKMAARMEALGADVLYFETFEGGHAGATNAEQRAFRSALAFSFLWKEMGPAHGGAWRGAPGRGLP